MYKITNFSISTKSMSQDITSRNFTVSGDPGAVFNLWVLNEDAYFYNFTSQAFENDSSKRLWGATIGSSGEYNGTIKFPAVTDDDKHLIYLRADNHKNTELDKTISSISQVAKVAEIDQLIDTTITFSLLHSSGTVTEPSNITVSVPRSSSITDSEYSSTEIDWTVTTSGVFTMIRQPSTSDFETTVTATHVGETTVGDTFVMDSIDNLTVGMAVSGSGIAGSPTITSMNPPTASEIARAYPVVPTSSIENLTTIVLTTPGGNHTINKGTVLTFTGSGTTDIEQMYNTSFDVIAPSTNVSDFKCVLTDMKPQLTSAVSASTTVPVDSVAGLKIDTTQTVDGAITSSNTVVLDSVTGLWVGQSLYSISAGTLTGTPTITAINSTTKTITLSSLQTFGDGITLKFANSVINGIGISDSTLPFIDGISSLNLTLNTAQTLEDDQVLTVTGSSTTATITGNIRVYYAGPTNFTATLNLDNFLIVA